MPADHFKWVKRPPKRLAYEANVNTIAIGSVAGLAP